MENLPGKNCESELLDSQQRKLFKSVSHYLKVPVRVRVNSRSAGLVPPVPIIDLQLDRACVQCVLNGSRIIWAFESAIFNYKEKEC